MEINGIQDPTSALVPSVLSARQANALHSPFLRLPYELLRLILSLSTPYPIYRRFGRYGPYRCGDQPGSHLSSWLRLGHVCHKVRDALLTMCHFWAEVAFLSDRLDVTQEIVRRAAGIPLTIVVSAESEEIPEDFTNFLMACLPRARHIEITSTQILSRIAGQFHGLHMPIVQKLIVDNRDYTDSAWPGGPHANVEQISGEVSWDSFEAVVTDEEEPDPIVAPYLRTLHLLNVMVPFDPSHLYELCLQLPERHEAEWPGYLIGILHHSSNLQVLDIGGMEFTPETATTGPIPLPRLRDLIMRGENACISWLWSQVTVANTAKVTTIIDGDLDVNPAVWDTIQALTPHALRARDAYPISGFSFLSKDPVQYILRFKVFTPANNPTEESNEHRFSPLRCGHRCILDVEVVCDIGIDSLHYNLLRLCDLFQLADVENLEIGTLERVDDKDDPLTLYSEWLSVFRDVRNLCLHYFPFPGYGIVDVSQDSEPDFALLYPNLQSLTIMNLSLDDGQVDDVIRLVKRRIAVNLPIQELKITFEEQAASSVFSGENMSSEIGEDTCGAGSEDTSGASEEDTSSASGQSMLRSIRVTLQNLVLSVELEKPKTRTTSHTNSDPLQVLVPSEVELDTERGVGIHGLVGSTR